MRYVGPTSLREVVLRRYNEASHLFLRDDQTLIVGDPIVKIGNNSVDVRDDVKANAEIDEAINALYDCSVGLNSVSDARRRIAREVIERRSNDYCTVISGGRADGFYDLTFDAIGISLNMAMNLFLLDICPESVPREVKEYYSATYPQILPHEIAHADISLVAPYKHDRNIQLTICSLDCGEIELNATKLVRPIMRILKNVLGDRVLPRQLTDFAGVPTVEYRRDRRMLVEGLRDKVSGLNREIVDMEIENLKLQERIGLLGIDALNEVMAYLVGWKFLPPKERKIAASDLYIKLFNFFGELVEKDPKTSIEIAKSVIEESWKRDKPILEVLGLSTG